MMHFFRKPTGDDIKRQQLAEAERCHAIYSAEQERMASHAEMYHNRIQRLKAELSSKGEA